MVTAIPPLPEQDLERFEPTAALKRSLKYEFAAELSPGLWKVIRKSDRLEFLARDETHRYQDATGAMTPLGHMMDPNGMDLMSPIMRLLNHENLINHVDWIQVQSTPNATLPAHATRQYIVWDFCNAGTLENLFMAEVKLPKSRLARDQERREAEDEMMRRRDHPELPVANPRPTPSLTFQPEAFCWHVLCSVLSALAWLHHGIREEWDCDKNDWEVKRADVDWHTVLHRTISPDKIFFCHPQTRFETYGICKLGDLSGAFVSGVFNGVLKDIVPPAKSQRVIAPQTGLSQDLRTLRKQTPNLENPPHPPKENQPYTITSEYRALADVVVAMMVAPHPSSEANKHWQRLRSLPIEDWQAEIGRTGYTKVLKNFMIELMTQRETDDATNPSSEPVLRPELTYRLYKKARGLYQRFRTVKDEGKDVITALHVQSEHGKRKRKEEEESERIESHRKDILKSFETSNRFRNEVDPPNAQERLLREIERVCTEVNSSTPETQFRPAVIL